MEKNVSQIINEELNKSVDVKTIPCNPKSPAHNPVNFNKNDNQINYMRFWLNSERMLSTPVTRPPESNDKVNNQVKSVGKSKPILVERKRRKRKTFVPVKKSKPNISYQERFKNGVKNKDTEDKNIIQTNFSGTAKENLTDCAGVKRKNKKSKPNVKNTTDGTGAKGKTVKKQRRFRGVPENVEILGIPLLKFGWRREIVYRQAKGQTADVYYHAPPPFNQKFRSKVEIAEVLLLKNYQEHFPSLTVNCFTFSRVILGLGEPYEFERNAISRGKDSKRTLPFKAETAYPGGNESESIEVEPLQGLEENGSTPDYMLTHEQWIGNLVY